MEESVGLENCQPHAPQIIRAVSRLLSQDGHFFVFMVLFCVFVDVCLSSYGLVRGAVRGNVAPDPATWVIEAATLDAMDCSWCASGLFEMVNIQPPAASQSSRSCGVSSQTQ